jgi:hypothetical protein
VELVDPDNPNTQDIIEIMLGELGFKAYELGAKRPEFYYTRMNKEGEIKLFHDSKVHPPPSLIIATRGEGAFVTVWTLASNAMRRHIGKYMFNIFKPDEIVRLEALLNRFKEICKRISEEPDKPINRRGRLRP